MVRKWPCTGATLGALLGLIGLTTTVYAAFPTPTRSTTIALTSDDRRAFVVNRDNNSVSVLEVRNAAGRDLRNKIIEIPVGIEPRCVAILPDDSKAYVVNAVSSTVSVISLTGQTTYRVIDTIPVGTEPRGCALTPSGAILYVANHTAGTVSVINTQDDRVVRNVNVGGNPWAIAITNDGDEDDFDERVFVTLFYSEPNPAGDGEGYDNGRRGVVRSFAVGGTANATATFLSPLANVGFTASRRFFCTQFNDNPPIHSDKFCPNKTTSNPDDPSILNAPQGAFANQLFAGLIRGSRLYVLGVGAGPEPPVQFNVNVQALVHVVNTNTAAEIANLHSNLNADVAQEPVPAEPLAGKLGHLFGNDVVALDANRSGNTMLIVSRGGNFVFRATLDNGKISLNPPNIVRFKTGNLPNGVVISSDGRRAYVNNEADMSVTRINLATGNVIAGTIAASEPPEPGTFEHAVLVGKLAFSTALGTPDNGIFSIPIRRIDPLQHRGKASKDAWSGCASCHPDGLSDKVVWIFGTGPRRTLSLDAFFSKRNSVDQRISNWSGVMGSITDFNNNSRGVQGGIGFASDAPFSAAAPNPVIFQHGAMQGASDALDAQTIWVQTVRTLNMPQPDNANDLNAGRAVFAANCASCHGGAKWTKSQVIYDANPTFPTTPDPAPPATPPAPLDDGVANARAQIISFTQGGETLRFLEDIGTFRATDPLEIRGAGRATDQLGRTALGVLGFNPPSLLAVAYNGPYLRNGRAKSLQKLFDLHRLGGGTIASELTGSQLTALRIFLNSIDGRTPTFDSATDEFLDTIQP